MRTTTLAFALAAVTLSGLPGCARTVVKEPLTTDYAIDDFGAEMTFWDGLKDRTAVTNDEALHGLLLTVDGEPRLMGYEARRAEAIARNWLPKDFAEPGNLAMQRGTFAVAVCKIADIKGGVIMSIVGANPRYATRELVYQGIMQGNSTEMMSISGSEFIAVISRMQDYMAARAAKPAPAAAPAKPVRVEPAATQPARPGFTPSTGPVGSGPK